MRRNEEIKVCCCLTYIQATSGVEITKIGIIIIIMKEYSLRMKVGVF